MPINKGDVVVHRTSGNRWTVIDVDYNDDVYTLETTYNYGNKAMVKEPLLNLISEYTKEQTGFEGLSLYSGLSNKPLDTHYCNHDWKVYHGFKHSDEYCTKCNEKRPIQDI